MIRLHILIKGQVQGINFRHYTHQKANELNLTGWVKNIDHNVEIIAEGEESSVNKLVEWCKDGPANAVVEDVKITEGEYKGEFKEFQIKF